MLLLNSCRVLKKLFSGAFGSLVMAVYVNIQCSLLMTDLFALIISVRITTMGYVS